MTRRSRRILAASISAATLTITLPILTGTASAAPDCRDLVIGVGGNGERQAHKLGYATMMDAHVADAAAQGKRTQSIDYKSSVWPTGAYTKDESVADGKAKLNDSIAAYRAECPNGNVTVIGHSLGAEVAQGAPADRVVLYGGPRTSRGIYQAIPGVYPGTSNPGVAEPAPNTVVVCHDFDAICDSPAPWSDPAKFIQGWAGYAQGWHGYAPNEGAHLAPGQEHYIDAPAPIPWLPESTPTGIPAAPELPGIPEWHPGPIPSFEDVQPIVEAFTPQPYRPVPVETYIPEPVKPIVTQVLPPEVLSYTPPPIEQIIPPVQLPVIEVPPLPDLGIRFP